MNIAKQFYGFVVLQIGEWTKLADFKPAAHNFANVIATRIENSEHETAIKEALRKKEKENEILLREVHHRTRNNLNVVTSLLGMQLETLSDPETRQALQFSIDRIDSIALVHNYLYRSDEQNSIKIKDFLKEFSDRILRTYQIRSKVHIENKISTVPLYIDYGTPDTEAEKHR